MRGRDGAGPDGDGGDGDRVGGEVDEAGADPDDVGDRVEGADLVEVHLLRRGAVDGRLGDREAFEGRQGEGADRRVEGRRLEQRPDVGPGAVVLGVGELDVAPGRREGAALDGLGAQRHRLRCDGADGVLQHGERDTGAEQRPEQHVAAGARRGVDPEGADHRGALCRATRAACTPAPYPLSMLTTVTPGAQELSIASRAATPPSEAP